jgi:hypothetical protein
MKTFYITFRDAESTWCNVFFARTKEAAVNKWRRQHRNAQFISIELGV